MNSRITDRLVKSAKPAAKDQFFRDTELTGFALKVTPAGRKVFVAEGRIKCAGTRRVTLGTYPALSTAEARRKAKRHIADIQSGTDPKIAIRADKLSNRTLGELQDEYLQVRDLRDSTVKDYRSVMSCVFDDWQTRRVKDLTREDVQSKFLKARIDHGERQTDKSFTILSAMFQYAKGDRIITENPCDILREKKLKAKPVRRDTFLTDYQVGLLFNLVSAPAEFLKKEHGITLQGANFVRLLMLTGMRKSEAMSLRWEDVSYSKGYLVLHDTKNRKEHYVPISKSTKWILETQRKVAKDSPWVFPSRYDPRKHMTEPKSQLTAIRKMVGFGFTFHDLRRTFATHADIHGVPFELIQRALNHSSGSVTSGYIVTQIDTLRPVFDKISEAYRVYYDPEAAAGIPS